MAETRTGLNNWLGVTGTQYYQELVRQAARAVSEITEEATSGVPRTVDVIRKVKTQDADSALGVAAQWSPVAGLTNLAATLFMPGEIYNDETSTDGAIKLKASQRVVLIADIPEAGGIPADKIMLTDKIKMDDPVYGDSRFAVDEIRPIRGAGLVHVIVSYSRDDV